MAYNPMGAFGDEEEDNDFTSFEDGDTDSNTGSIFEDDDFYVNNMGNSTNGINSDISSQVQATPEEAKHSKKIAIIGLVVGSIIIIIALAISSNLNKRKEIPSGSISKENIYSNSNESYEDSYDESYIEETNTQVQDSSPNIEERPVIELEKPKNTSGNTDSSVVKFKAGYYGPQSEQVESVFNITERLGYLSNGNALRYCVKGTIDGLTGIYELEVGYDIVNKLKDGDRFKVWYKTLIIDDKVLVSDISSFEK